MALTEEHFARLAAFVDARVEEQFEGSHVRRGVATFDDSGEARALRALRHTVSVLRARGPLLNASMPESLAALDDDGSMAIRHKALGRHTAELAWNGLCDIAREWKDHPDWHSDFALYPYELPDEPAAAEIGKG